jgi:hypothetical protein
VLRRRVILWQAIRWGVREVYICCPRGGFVLHVDWGIRGLPHGSCAHSRAAYPCGRFLIDPSLQLAPGCVNSSNALGENCALSSTDRLSRIPSNRTRLVVSHVELLAASLSRPTVASARVLVFTSNNIGVCMDDEYAAAYSGR